MGCIKSTIFKFATASAMLLSVTAFSVSALAEELTELTPEKLEQIIHDYLMENPEVMIRSLDTYYKEQEKLAQAEAEKMLDDLLPAIRESVEYPVGGNPDGTVTMVEFFDYNCGFCKRVLPQINNIMQDDESLRVLFVELPILSPSSLMAAKAALAADMQGKYMDFHLDMMGARGAITEKRIFRIAESTGLDIDKLKADMESEAITEQINRNRQLAQMLNLSGTPAFIIGDEIIRGAIDEATMRDLIEKAKEES